MALPCQCHGTVAALPWRFHGTLPWQCCCSAAPVPWQCQGNPTALCTGSTLSNPFKKVNTQNAAAVAYLDPVGVNPPQQQQRSELGGLTPQRSSTLIGGLTPTQQNLELETAISSNISYNVLSILCKQIQIGAQQR